MPTVSFTTRIDADLKAKLDAIAKAEDRSASYIANRAIEAMVNEREAFLADLDEVEADVEARGTISGEEMMDWLESWAKGEERPLPQPKLR